MNDLEAAIKKALREQYPDGPTPQQMIVRKALSRSDGEEAFWFQLTKLSQVPRPAREVKLIEGRAWRYDFVWFEARIVFEIEGGVWTGGRHTRGKGFSEDIRKYQAAQALGYQVYRFTTEMVTRGEALRAAEKLLLK